MRGMIHPIIEALLFISIMSPSIAFAKCPMPELENSINEAYSKVMADRNDANGVSLFVKLLKKSMYRYDCKRFSDSKTVPVLWLAERANRIKWLSLLADLDSIEAKQLFGSELFRKTLDGSSAERYRVKSHEVEFLLNNPGKLPHYPFKLFGPLPNGTYKDLFDSYDSLYSDFSISASSNLANVGKITYLPENMADMNMRTAWIEGVEGYGVGEYFVVKLSEPIAIKGMLLINGYAKSKKIWTANGRVKMLTLFINDVGVYRLPLIDSSELQEVRFPEINLEKWDSLRLEISEVFSGAKYKDTGLSEFYLLRAF